MTPPTIQIDVGGTRVRGQVVERSAAAIEVLLLSPHGEYRLSDGRYIMALARPYTSFEGHRGDLAAEQILAGLYRLASHIAAELPGLRHRWNSVREQLYERCRIPVRTAEELGRGKKALREQLRSAEISTFGYERSLRLLRADYDSWLVTAEDAVDGLWKEAGFDIPLELQLKALRVIDPNFMIGEEED